MPKIAIIRYVTNVTYNNDDYDVYKIITDSITDWYDVTAEELEIIESNLDKTKFLVVEYLTKTDTMLTVKDHLEAAKVKKEKKKEREAKRLISAAKRAKKLEEEKKKKELALLKELESKYKNS